MVLHKCLPCTVFFFVLIFRISDIQLGQRSPATGDPDSNHQDFLDIPA